ncbi:Glycosyl hydrolases family 25 [Butyrivibrio proteoclasticus]|uniref:Glycosyl hydrolases family 25 n=1 Tax=Butyrivibrio proteoclasticus TaxID=43305 RepID=A0A1I5S3W5_9FIRM|nr:GH25 family lysozyme [Butyrivibrio proteoclasticus]SFP65390.1 Glycosyl hydrolases family 25 [Butyrivibrio proteoclasticus]
MKSNYGDHGRHRRKRYPGGMTVKIVIAAVVICICAAIFLVRSFVKRNADNEASKQVSVLELEEIEEPIPEEEPVVAASIEASVNEEQPGEAAVEASSEEEELDIQMGAGAETGEDIDVADLVSASNVGENSSITYGIDVSRFQGTIDWAQVAASGIDFAMIRVGYRDSSTGELKADSNARFNMQEAEKNGIKIGAYFFSTAVNKDEAVAEANWVKDYIAQYPITYPVGYNCEGFDKESSRQYSLTKDERSSIAEAFLDQIYKAGYTPIFYASMGELAGDVQWNTSQIEKSYKIWMAWYNQNTSNIANGPAYDGQCAMWQYTNQGTVAGISKKVDVDVAYFGYNGTETAKDTSERVTATADVEALMSFDTVDETVTAKNSTNLRDKPSQGDDSKVVVTLQNGQTAQRTGISSSGWSRVVLEGSTYYAVSSFLTTDLTAPKQETEQPVTTSGFKTQFADCNETVTAKDIVNLRSKPSVTDEDSTVAATLSSGDTATRTGINTDYGWSRVEYNGQTLYCVSSYLRVVE